MKRLTKILLFTGALSLASCSFIKNHLEIKPYESFEPRKAYEYPTKYDTTKVKEAMNKFYENVQEKLKTRHYIEEKNYK